MITRKTTAFVLAFALVFSCVPPSARAEWVWSPELGKFVSPKADESRDNSSQQFDYAMDLYKQKQYAKAADSLEDLVKHFPASRIAPEAVYRLGTIYEDKGDYYKALKSYQKLIETYPQNERFEEVIEREFKLGNLFLSGKKGQFFGIEIRPALPLAVQAFEHITKYAPYGAFGDQAQFSMATAQKRSGQYQAALDSFQTLLDNYPQSSLVEKARYELAETAYFRSIAEARDERALEKASEQVKGFMERYPSAQGTEKAAKIREEIDDKNAEKNYRIGEFYEKENYVQSALIYYQDVAKRYSYTQWGAKAAKRLQALKQPVQFLATERDKLEADYDDTKKRLAALGTSGDAGERDALSRKLVRLEKRRKSLEKEKGDNVSRLSQDLKRREDELKQKFKNLDIKIKKHKDNQSEDFKKAIERWRASLESERDALDAEKQQLAGWSSQIGVAKPFYEGWVPFAGEPKTPLQKIQAIDAKNLYKISEKKKKTLDEKELLYKQHQEVSLLAGGQPSATAAQPKLKEADAQLQQKLSDYEKRFGRDEWLAGVRRNRGLSEPAQDSVNPFNGTALASKNPQEILELRMHLREQVTASQNVVDTLSTAFNEELALSEQERLAERLEGKGQGMDPQELRKEIKKTEKDIRYRYEDIEERDKHKKKLLDQLDHLVGSQAEKTTAQKIAAPVLFPVKVVKVFLFGRDSAATALTQKAGKSSDVAAQDVKKEIETDSLMIQAQSEEISQLEKKLEILKAQSSLNNGGNQFRSSFVKVPYVFIEDAIDNAAKLVTTDQRQDLLIEKLDQKTKELEALKRELADVEAAVSKLPDSQKPDDSLPAAAQPAADSSEREGVRADIEKLVQTLQPVSPAPELNAAQMASANPKVLKELHEIESSLVKVIGEQMELEDAEKKVLEKRMRETDTQLQKVTSQATRADLVAERERMDARITEIGQRRDFLEKEKSRFTK